MKKNSLKTLAIVSASTLAALALAYATIASYNVPIKQDTSKQQIDLEYYQGRHQEEWNKTVAYSEKQFENSAKGQELLKQIAQTEDEAKIDSLANVYNYEEGLVISENLNKMDDYHFNKMKKTKAELDSLNAINAKRAEMLKVPSHKRFQQNLALMFQKTR